MSEQISGVTELSQQSHTAVSMTVVFMAQAVVEERPGPSLCFRCTEHVTVRL